MTDTGGGPSDRNAVPPQAQDDASKAFQLRPERPGVTRISRRVLIGGTALVLALVSGAVFVALQSSKKRAPASEELYSTDHRNVADQLAGLPKDYIGVSKDVPPLGPPLPGDLGR